MHCTADDKSTGSNGIDILGQKTNFRAADMELQSLISQLDQEKIKESIANKGIVWHFNPP